MEAIMEIATKHSIPVVEDTAQAHGATFKGQVVGSFGAFRSEPTAGCHLDCGQEGRAGTWGCRVAHVVVSVMVRAVLMDAYYHG